MLAHFTITIQDHIIPQTKKDDDIQAVIAIVNEEVAKPFFSWPFGGGQTASDSSKNKEREQLAAATKAKPVTQTVRST